MTAPSLFDALAAREDGIARRAAKEGLIVKTGSWRASRLPRRHRDLVV